MRDGGREREREEKERERENNYWSELALVAIIIYTSNTFATAHVLRISSPSSGKWRSSLWRKTTCAV
jgi:hypothetical protein